MQKWRDSVRYLSDDRNDNEVGRPHICGLLSWDLLKDV